MQLQTTAPHMRSSDMALIAEYLPLQHSTLLELGCGRAQTTRRLAESAPTARIIATEVDRIQHEKNRQITDLPNVSFLYGGAEAIDMEAASVDAVIMLKSLHHVPLQLIPQGLDEIHRVLKPGGLAYFSEPVFAGDFNDIIRLFHNEQHVREVAFSHLQGAVACGQFELAAEVFFESSSRYQGFGEFEERIIGATHSDHRLDDALYATVKAAFEKHLRADGSAEFFTPQRLDLLRKPAQGPS